jgi:hypothetical protein
MDWSRVTWRKASYSGANGGGCVEAARMRSSVAVRDSKNPDGPKLAFSDGEWKAFTRRIKAGKLTGLS